MRREATICTCPRERRGKQRTDLCAERSATHRDSILRDDEGHSPIKVGPLGARFVFGDFGQVWAEFLSHFGPLMFHGLLSTNIESVVKLMSHSFSSPIGIALEAAVRSRLILGISENPAHFLVSEIELAAYRYDEPWLETLTTSDEYLNLPSSYSPQSDPKMKFRPRRITGDDNDWRMRYMVAQAVIQTSWYATDQPFAYIVECARNLMRARLRSDEQDHIEAGGQGIGLEVLDSSAEALRSSETDAMPLSRTTNHSISATWTRCEASLQIEGGRRSGKMRQRSLSWPKSRVEAARAKFCVRFQRIRKEMKRR